MISAPNGSYVEKLFLKNREDMADKFKPLLGFAGISLFKTSIIDEFKLLKNQSKFNLFGFLIKNAFEKKKKIFHTTHLNILRIWVLRKDISK